MILILCLMQNNALQSILAFFSWTILHTFFSACLSHLTLTGHMGYCCAKKGPRVTGACNQKMMDSIRALLDVTYSVILPVWAVYLILTHQLDVESHAFLLIAALGYNVYATYWAVKNFTWTRTRNFLFENRHRGPMILGKNKVLNLTLCSLSTAVVLTSIKVLSVEMTRWRNSIIPIMLDMHPSSSWAQPTVVQRKALSHHLLSKQSEIAWLLTLNLLVHELPNLFFNILKLLRLSNFQTNQMKHCVWTTDNYCENVKAAATLGAAAWRRERGITCPPCRRKSTLEELLSRLHRLSFVLIRVLGGFIVLNRILMTEILVRDTSFTACALLYLGIAIYLFGGIVSYTAKHTKSKYCPRKSLSWQIATSINDEWLNFN